VARKKTSKSKSSTDTQEQARKPAAPDYKIKHAEGQIRALIEKGKKKGFLTYEEMNDQLPEEAG
jgi:hypothetical protein